MVIDPDAVPALAFALSDELPPGSGAWHQHRRHQLLFAAAGCLHLEVGDARWMLPPQRAAWIDGDTPHRVELRAPASLRTIYLDPTLGPPLGVGCRVFAVGELASVMIRHAMRWGPKRPAEDPLADHYFTTLGMLAREWAQQALPTCLPRPRSPQLQRALAYLLEHLEDEPTAANVARAGAMSERSLARRLRRECGTSFRALRQAARMMRAMELLLVPETSVTEVCYALGYGSLGTFSSSFREFAGVSPRQWRAEHLGEDGG
ncbi:MAG: helix-turn-helix transcriptional regulator [Myxococcota bacterium]